MRNEITKEHIIDWLCVTANEIEKNEKYLTQLDAAIGDAEHGLSMNRGFKKVVSQMDAIKEKDIGSILKGVGTTLMSSVGGASGVLFGTLFIKAGGKVAGKDVLDVADMSAALKAGLLGVIERGRAQVGDKTMVDALAPAVETFSRAAEKGTSMIEALREAADAAEQGMKATTDLIAKKGRASYLGDRSIGHQDPGATSIWLIFEALYTTVSQRLT
jgi:dihydroxyacetone kinase-like protein